MLSPCGRTFVRLYGANEIFGGTARPGVTALESQRETVGIAGNGAVIATGWRGSHIPSNGPSVSLLSTMSMRTLPWGATTAFFLGRSPFSACLFLFLSFMSSVRARYGRACRAMSKSSTLNWQNTGAVRRKMVGERQGC